MEMGGREPRSLGRGRSLGCSRGGHPKAPEPQEQHFQRGVAEKGGRSRDPAAAEEELAERWPERPPGAWL